MTLSVGYPITESACAGDYSALKPITAMLRQKLEQGQNSPFWAVCAPTGFSQSHGKTRNGSQGTVGPVDAKTHCGF